MHARSVELTEFIINETCTNIPPFTRDGKANISSFSRGNDHLLARYTIFSSTRAKTQGGGGGGEGGFRRRGTKARLDRRGWKKEGEGGGGSGPDFNKNFARGAREEETREMGGGKLGICCGRAGYALSLSLPLPPTPPRVQGGG